MTSTTGGSTPAPPPSAEQPKGTHASLAAVPIAVLVGLTFLLLVRSGYQELGDAAADARLFEIIGAADPYGPMLYGSIVAFTVACLGALTTRSLGPRGVLRGAAGGASPLVEALSVLFLAWFLGDLIEAAGTGAFLTSALGGWVSPWMLPAATFVLAALTAFSVGSSFFTMGALIPLVLPLALSLEGGVIGPVVLASCAAVLDGAVLGDHASPISDTTILSALGSAVDVVVHVTTQLPYVLVAGTIAILVGAIPAGLGAPVWALIPLGMATSIAAVLILGRRPETA